MFSHILLSLVFKITDSPILIVPRIAHSSSNRPRRPTPIRQAEMLRQLDNLGLIHRPSFQSSKSNVLPLQTQFICEPNPSNYFISPTSQMFSSTRDYLRANLQTKNPLSSTETGFEQTVFFHCYFSSIPTSTGGRDISLLLPCERTIFRAARPSSDLPSSQTPVRLKSRLDNLLETKNLSVFLSLPFLMY